MSEPGGAQLKREVNRAIWRRADPPPGHEDFAFRRAMRYSMVRWLTWVYALGVLVELWSLSSSRTRQPWNAVLLVICLVLAVYWFFLGRRAREAVDRWTPTVKNGGETRDS